MTLQTTLDAFRANFEAGNPPYNAPASIHPIMKRATAELIASGLARRARKAGERAPMFTLPRYRRTLGVVGATPRRRPARHQLLSGRLVPVLQP